MKRIALALALAACGGSSTTTAPPAQLVAATWSTDGGALTCGPGAREAFDVTTGRRMLCAWPCAMLDGQAQDVRVACRYAGTAVRCDVSTSACQ